MRVLFIVGGELSVNSSANLCHLAYIRGFCAAGHAVEVLSARDGGARTDPAMALPAEVRAHETYPVSVYEKLSHLKNRARGDSAAPAGTVPDGAAEGSSLLSRVKRGVRSLYGVYGTDVAWLTHVKHFRSEKYYDVVISLSCPFVSHRAAEYLIGSGRIDCGRWIQIWEDPWYGDLAYDSRSDLCLREERRLCAAAREIVYVSPVTLMYQQKLFPQQAHKMRFVPTPAYYPPEADASPGQEKGAAAFGYFGDYEPSVRNLAPFYEAAKETGVRAYLCGSSSAPFPATERISVLPRMPLAQLHPYEKKVGALVFLCNLRGGQIHGKIYQYSAQEKPILFILDGTDEEKKAIRAYFAPLDRYVFCENEKEDIKRAIGEILAGNAPRRATDAFSPVNTVAGVLGGIQN